MQEFRITNLHPKCSMNNALKVAVCKNCLLSGWALIGQPPHAKSWLIGKDWCWEGLGAGGEGDDKGCDGWMASLTRWTWVWVNSGSWWWTGRPGVLRFMGLQRVRHDWATELNWTELLDIGVHSPVRTPLLWFCSCLDWRGPAYSDDYRFGNRRKFLLYNVLNIPVGFFLVSKW